MGHAQSAQPLRIESHSSRRDLRAVEVLKHSIHSNCFSFETIQTLWITALVNLTQHTTAVNFH